MSFMQRSTNDRSPASTDQEDHFRIARECEDARAAGAAAWVRPAVVAVSVR